MKAVVMAGGEGSRLRPLTCNCPKPLVPVVNKPIMQHILELLRRHHVDEVVVTVHYLGEQIQAAFGDGSDLGLKLHYTHEETPLGTAGAVKLGEQWLRDEPFLIVSGDALTDMDLTALWNFHHEQKSVATLGLVRVANPLEYGVVVTERDGRVRRFLEKPDWSEVFSDTVNTGIYCLSPEVFDLIPSDRSCDWSKDVFPQLLNDNRPMFGYVSNDYWCDVGSLPVYRQAQADALLGKVRLEIPGESRGRGLWVGAGAVIEEGANVEGPALIGEGARVKAGAVVEEFSVVGAHCRIEPGARVVNSVLWDGVFVGEQARVGGAIVGRNTTLGRGAVLNDEVVIGERCRIGSGATIASLVRVWPDKFVESGAHVTMTLVWSEGVAGSLLRDGAVRGVPNREMTPDFATRLATAYGACLPRGARVVTGRDAHPACRMVKRAVVAGLMSAGVDVTDLQAVPEPMARYAVRTSSAAGGLYLHMSATDRGAMTMEIFDSLGICVDRNFQRKLESVFSREDFRRADVDEIGRLDVAGESSVPYVPRLLDRLDSRPIRERRFQVVLDCASSTASSVAPHLFGSLDCRLVTVNGFPNPQSQPRTPESRDRSLRNLSAMVATLEADLGAMLNEEGSALYVVDSTGRILSGHELLAVMGSLFFRRQQGGTLVAPITASSALERLAAQHGGTVLRTKNDERSLVEGTAAIESGAAMAGDLEGHFIFPKFQCAFDGISALAFLLELLARQDISLRQAAEAAPEMHVRHRRIPCPWDRKGEIMRLLGERSENANADFTDGLKVFDAEGWVLYKPDAAEPAFHLYAEGKSPQALDDLVARSERELAQLSAGGK